MNMETVVSGKTRAVTWMGTEYVITLDKAASAGLIGVFEGKVPAGEGPPIHIHHNEDEVLHILVD